MIRRLALISLLLAAHVCTAERAHAQIMASELARIEQTVDGTLMRLDYSRPRLRGRDTIIGGQVHWDEVWTPGANWATKFHASRDIRINGETLPAGTYSMWFVLREDLPWTVLFDADTTRGHTQRPKPDSAVLRFDISPETAPTRETLTWQFIDYTHDGATLEFAWDEYRVPLTIEVTSSQRMHATAGEAARVVGSYAMDWTMQRNQPPKPGTLDVRFDSIDGTLRAVAKFADMPEWQLLLAPRSASVFVAVFLQDGQVWQTAENYFFEFETDTARAGTVDLRLSTNDRLLGSGRRSETATSRNPSPLDTAATARLP